MIKDAAMDESAAEGDKQRATEKSRRIIMFCDLRDSTDILLKFDRGEYQYISATTGLEFTYDQFLLDVHKTSYEYLYLGHKKTHTEIYGDGLMTIFPEDNTKPDTGKYQSSDKTDADL